MEIEQYELKRAELITYIDEALSLPRIAAKMSETLKVLRKKIFENQFRIVLISGFESGKSTTFNAICDGQEISPRGAMVRTSATVISAQNTADPLLVGKAAVLWRSDKELSLIFSKYLLQTLKRIDRNRFGSLNQGDQLSECLTYPEDLHLVLSAVTTRLQEIEKSTDDISTEEKEALRMAKYICEFYESPLIRQIKSMKTFSVEDVEKMVCFPENWNRADKIKNALSDKDCIFLFVKEAHVYIKSESLMRTGSILIDCPGLFASNYDTRVAFDILENADAVWYILNGKGMGQDDIDCAKRLTTAKPDKIFYTINMPPDNTETNVKKRIIQNYVDTFEDLKVKLEASEFMPYNALLALTAVQAQKYMDGTLDEHSQKAIYQLAERFGTKYDSFEDILCSWAEKALSNVYNFSRSELKKFDLFAPDGSGIKLISDRCGLEKILSKIENFVVKEKAYSVLVENGSRKAIELLSQLEADLKVEEKIAAETEGEMENAFEEAQDRLDAFQSFCDAELDELRDETVDHSLALDYWQDVIVSGIDEVAQKSAEQIAKLNCNEVRQEENEQIVNDTFSDVVLPRATAWADNIRNGKNATFNALISRRIAKIIKNTNDKWALTIQDQPVLTGLPVPTPIIGTDVIATEFIDSVVAKTPGVSGEVVTGVATCMAIGVLLGSFVFPGVGSILGGAIGSVVGAVIGNGVGSERREKVIYEAIKEELIKNVVITEQTEPDKSVILKQEKRIKALRHGVIKAFEDAFKETENAFEERRRKALDLFRVQTAQREKLAEAHRKFRKEKIEPLRRKIDAYEEVVKNMS